MESFENYFLQIYEKHKKFVYTVIRFHTKDSRSSDDIFQEAWLEIYRGLEKFRGDSKISTWIYSVVRNRTLNFLKRENRTAKAENEAGREIVRAGAAELSRSDIADAVEGLNAEHREVIFLRYTLQMSYEDIAGQTGVPVSTVKSRLFEAKKILREKLLK